MEAIYVELHHLMVLKLLVLEVRGSRSRNNAIADLW
jgi:hypothetical protein